MATEMCLPPDGGLGPAPGQMAALASGQGAMTHYRLEGPADGRLVVLIHGINDFSFRFDMLAPALAGASFRVLRYDAYGRGWSGTPPGARFDADMHLQQLEELVSHIGAAGTPLSIIAHSMGAITAVLYCASHADQVERLVLMAPAGIMQAPFPGFSLAQKCLQCCSCLLGMVGGSNPPPGDFHDLDDAKVKALSSWNLAWTRAHLGANGGLAFASSAARMPLISLQPAVEALAGAKEKPCTYPVLILRADHDPMVVLREKDIAVYKEALGSRVSDRLISSAAHCFFLERSEETLGALLEFL
eukprot:gb/GFBE01012764.1/.p1 GENE.gb/GFBE01012764.1/~~gb/GFBE01012764.1/.p1  ORF type:complete len:302 (+),score=56.85 gb/GFBE01012764.1/:1-906(+)